MKKLILLIVIFNINNLKSQSWNTVGNSGTNPTINYIGTNDPSNLIFKVNNDKKMELSTTGQLKIGNFLTGPSNLNAFKLAVNGMGTFYGNLTNGDMLDVVNNAENIDTGMDLIYGVYGSYQPNDVGMITLNSKISPTVNQTVFTVRANGKVGMGTNQYNCTNCAGYRLFVKDGIKTEKVKVDIAADNGWADYVFKKDYKLLPLKELDSFILNNGHLPEVPTTEEAITNGIELKEMNILLLKKIEELTLYIISQDKRIEKLENNHLK